MLANAQLPDPQNFASIGWVIVIIGGLIWGLRNGIGFVRDLKDKPAPGDVQREAAAMFAQKRDLEAHVATTDSKFERLAKQRDEDLKNAAAARKDMHEDIAAIDSKVSALAATTDLQTGQLDRLDKKLDGMPERVIATLKTTGAI